MRFVTRCSQGSASVAKMNAAKPSRRCAARRGSVGVGTLVVLVTVIVLAHLAGGYVSHRIRADMAVVNRSAAMYAAHAAAQLALAELAKNRDLDGDRQIGSIGAGSATELKVGPGTATAAIVTREARDQTSEQERVLEVQGRCGDSFHRGELSIGDLGLVAVERSVDSLTATKLP